ncbi:hypothetical protein AVEN_199827-1 [Araneus ventricosus]|uniref:Uncharacterized protein n=1 Tax=Araneus ventricosus TaxID=182803 RepID=A0A4Y2DU92_ARAVE|nr:hypothetical protein AVEN_199827-1 [Araneus ventricosus]
MFLCGHRTCIKDIQRCIILQHGCSSHKYPTPTKVTDFSYVGGMVEGTTLSLDVDLLRITLCTEFQLIGEEDLAPNLYPRMVYLAPHKTGYLLQCVEATGSRVYSPFS